MVIGDSVLRKWDLMLQIENKQTNKAPKKKKYFKHFIVFQMNEAIDFCYEYKCVHAIKSMSVNFFETKPKTMWEHQNVDRTINNLHTCKKWTEYVYIDLRVASVWMVYYTLD